MARCTEEALKFVVLIHLIQCYNNLIIMNVLYISALTQIPGQEVINLRFYVDLFCFICSCTVCLLDDQGRKFLKTVVIFAVYQNLGPWVVGGWGFKTLRILKYQSLMICNITRTH